MKTTKDCPCNCPYLILAEYGCGCELGILNGAPITAREGGTVEID